MRRQSRSPLSKSLIQRQRASLESRGERFTSRCSITRNQSRPGDRRRTGYKCDGGSILHIVCASRSKRCFISGLGSENCRGRTLSATVRLSRLSAAGDTLRPFRRYPGRRRSRTDQVGYPRRVPWWRQARLTIGCNSGMSRGLDDIHGLSTAQAIRVLGRTSRARALTEAPEGPPGSAAFDILAREDLQRDQMPGSSQACRLGLPKRSRMARCLRWRNRTRRFMPSLTLPVNGAGANCVTGM